MKSQAEVEALLAEKREWMDENEDSGGQRGRDRVGLAASAGLGTGGGAVMFWHRIRLHRQSLRTYISMEHPFGWVCSCGKRWTP